jgi:hypothetical protein
MKTHQPLAVVNALMGGDVPLSIVVAANRARSR